MTLTTPAPERYTRFSCPNPQCTCFNRPGAGNIVHRSWTGTHQHIERLRCTACDREFSEREGTLMARSKLPEDTVVRLAQLSLSRFLSGMMRLSHHHTVTGGTTHGRCTVCRAAVPPDGVPGFHQPDARRVSAARPALRDRVPNPYGGMAGGWETADRTPVCRLHKLPSADTRRPALVHLGLPENVRTPGGARALIRDGAGQSESVDPRPVAGIARGAARPWRCPR